MPRQIRRALIACLIAFATAGIHAQRGRAGGAFDPTQLPPGGGGGRGGRFGGPARDAQPAPTGTALISGRIISADTGNPVRRAQVRITAAEIRVNRVATTDNDGHYEFTNLAAGSYRLFVSKAGFVNLEYGQAHPFESGKPLDVRDGQRIEKTDFSLPRGSVIAGRITDEVGEPIADATVQAMRYQFVNGQRQLAPAGRQATTDDIGQFRIFGLMPGDYIVRASVREGPQFAGLLGADTQQDSTGYAPMYYPGTPDAAQAQSVSVALGQEINSVFFSLSPARLARISGTAIDSQGRPLTGAIVMLRSQSSGGAFFGVGNANQIRPDGSFVISNVAPGEYTLEVQQRPRDVQNIGSAEFASIPLSVSGADIGGLTVITTTGVSVSGRVVLQGQKAQSTSPRSVLVSALPATGQPTIMGMAGRALGGRVGDDGAFQLNGLAGQQLIRVAGVPTGWTVQSITLEGQDITDTAFDFKPGRNLNGLTITLTDKVSDLSGTVKDANGAPAKDYVLVVFPQDPRLWSGTSRYVRAARPNQDGAYDIKGLPEGSYYAAVVESLENGRQGDPALLDSLRTRAKQFSLLEGQTLTLDLPLQP